MTGLSEDCCAYATTPMMSKAGATICVIRANAVIRFRIVNPPLAVLVPLIGKYYRCPAIATPLLAQATEGWKIHMRPRDQNILAREPRQQLMSRRRSRSLVDVKYRGYLGLRQLDAQCMDDVTPKQDFLPLGRKFIAGMSRGMTRQRDELHAVDDSLGASKRVPLTGLDVRRCDGLRTLEERLRILRRLGSDFRRQPKVAFGLRDVNFGLWKDALSVLSGQAADVIGMEVGDQNDVDFFRRVACAAEAAGQGPERCPTIPSAGARIDEDKLLAGVDQETRNRSFQHVRIFVQFLYDTIHRRLRSVQPVRIEHGETIE